MSSILGTLGSLMGSVVADLRQKHQVLYKLIEFLCDYGFKFKSVTYMAEFDGSFTLEFRLKTNQSSKKRFFRINRDGRDTIVALEELLPTDRQDSPYMFVNINTLNFQAENAWTTGIISVGKKLIQGIK